MSKPTERAAFEAWLAGAGYATFWDAWQASAKRFGQAEPVAWQVAASFWHKFESIPEALRKDAKPLYAAPQPDRVAELEATRDMLDDARMQLDMLRDALGVPVEPHQSLFERMRDAALQRAALAEEVERLTKALERSLNWLASYPGGGAEGCYLQAREALAARADVSGEEGGAPE